MGVNSTAKLAHRVGSEQDDVLATLQLVVGDPLLEAHLWDRLVDLLVEGLFVDLRQRSESGAISQDAYLAELAATAEACRRVGLLPTGAAGR